MIRAAAALAALALAGCATTERPETAGAPAAAVSSLLGGSQYLYGSAEGEAISRQAWNLLVDHIAAHRGDHRGVVLAEGATLAAPRFVNCGTKPPAAVFDVDETVLLNLGYERAMVASGRAGFDLALWDAWERTGAAYVAPVPGAREGLARLRAMGVTVIFNTNRSAKNAAGTEDALNRAGLGPAIHGRTLYLMGDDNTGSLKDVRRWWIADKFCVVALAGDQLGDFSDLFNVPSAPPLDRRVRAAAPAIAGLWGRGWFVLPNPVYGAAEKGTAADIFPAGSDWPQGAR